MAGRVQLKASFTSELKLESFYTGGKAVISRDELTLAAPCGEDIKVVELATGVVKHTLQGDSEAVTTLTFSPDGKILANGSKSMRLRFWNLADGTCTNSIKAHDTPVMAMDFDSTGTFLATGASDSGVRVWDVAKGFCTHSFRGHKGVISCVRFHPDANRWTLFTASDNGEIRVWDLLARACTAVLASHVSSVRSLDISPDGYSLLSAGRDQVLTLWNLRTNALEKTLPIFETLEAAFFVPSTLAATKRKKADEGADAPKTLVVTAGDKGHLRMWDLATGAVVRQQADRHPNEPAQPYIDALWCPGQSAVAAVTLQNTILFFKVPSFKPLRQLVGTNDEVIDLQFVGPAEDRIAVATTSEQIRLYDVATRNCELLSGHSDVVLALHSSGDGSHLASGSKDHDVRLWQWSADAYGLACVGLGVGHTEAVGAVALPHKPTSRFLLSGSEDRTIKCWDWTTADGSDGEPTRLPTSFTVLAHDKDINSLAVAPNDKLFASGSQDRTAKLWNVADGTLVGVFRGHKRGVWSVAFSPVDLVLATSSGDKTIKLWSLSDFSCLRTFEGHTMSVLRVTFLSHGMQLLSAGTDGLLKLWTIKTNDCVGTFDGHDDRIWAVAVKRDESAIVSGGGDSVVQLWRDATAEEAAERMKEAELLLEREQDLANFLQMKDYKRAVELCLTLDKPRRLLGIFGELLDNGDASRESTLGSPEVEAVLRALQPAQLEQVLRYVRDWNTNGKLSAVAQAVLHTLLRRFTADELLALKEIKATLQALEPYTQRHLNRLDQLLTRSFILDAALVGMDTINPL